MGGPLVRWRHQTVIAGESLPVTRAQGNVLKQDLQANHWESLSACWHGSRWRALGVRGVGASCWPGACSTMNQKPGVAACGEKEGIWARQIKPSNSRRPLYYERSIRKHLELNPNSSTFQNKARPFSWDVLKEATEGREGTEQPLLDLADSTPIRPATPSPTEGRGRPVSPAERRESPHTA